MKDVTFCWNRGSINLRQKFGKDESFAKNIGGYIQIYFKTE